MPNLPVAVNAPTKQARDKVSEGSYWAGRAINITKTTAPHAFSYPFTTYYGYPHGHAVALTFPFFYKLYIDKTISRKMLFLKEVLREDVSDYIEGIGLDLILKDTIDISEVVDKCNISRMRNYPIVFEKESVFSFLKGKYE